MKLILLFLYLAFVAQSPLTFSITAPTRAAVDCSDLDNPTLIHGLEELRVYRVYFNGNDTTRILTIPAYGGEGDTFPFVVPRPRLGGMGIYYVTAKNNVGESCIGPQYLFAEPYSEPVPGLQGAYFDSLTFGQYKFTRVDSDINFLWGLGSPDPSIAPDQFTIRWTGLITIPTSEQYTFYTDVEDGNRLWINGIQVINNWGVQNRHENSGQITLNSGTHSFLMEYMAYNGNANCILKWSTVSIPKQVIPASAYTH